MSGANQERGGGAGRGKWKVWGKEGEGKNLLLQC